MVVANMQLKENHTCIFVSFSDVKAVLLNEARVVKQPLLRVQLDERGEIREFDFVSKTALLKASFVAKKEGVLAPRVVKLKPPAPSSLDTATKELEFAVTDAITIVRKEAERHYEYSIVYKEKDTLAQMRRKAKRKKQELTRAIEHVLFIVPKTDKKEKPKGRRTIAKSTMTNIALWHDKKKEQSVESTRVTALHSPMRMLHMRGFEAGVEAGTVRPRFLGPGDHAFAPVRAAPYR